MPVINSLFNMVTNPLPFVDAFTTFGSLFAMYLMVKRYKEQWILWIIINALSIIMWLKIGDMVMVVMWSAYLVNSVYGLYKWSK
jgi:nicotinamide mononucleotide transporter